MDLKSGFNQVMVHPKDREKTAFVTPFGLYQYKVMPFGLSNAPATFQSLMCTVLSGLNYVTCLVYVDDIIVFSKTFDEHLQRLREVFVRLQNANLKINTEKCHFLKDSVEFLGHIVSRRGVEADPKKVEAVKNFPQPRDVTDLQSFLGLAGYYRKFIKDFGSVADPLYELTKKGVDFV